jgi:hypothetical protein
LTLRELLALMDRHSLQVQASQAMVCAVLCELKRDPKKRAEPFSPADFMPGEPEPEKSPEQIWSVIEQLNVALGGQDLRQQHA